MSLSPPQVISLDIATAILPLEDKVSPYFEVLFYLFFSTILSSIVLGWWSAIVNYSTRADSDIKVWSSIVMLAILLYLNTKIKFIHFILSRALNYLALPKQRRYNNGFLVLLLSSTVISGLSLALCLRTGMLTNPYLFYLIQTQSLIPSYFYLILTTFLSLGLLALALIFTFVMSKIQRNHKIADYRRKEEHLIKL